jgi:hypothetical protein
VNTMSFVDLDKWNKHKHIYTDCLFLWDCLFFFPILIPLTGL